MTFCGELGDEKNSVFSDFCCPPDKLALTGLRPGYNLVNCSAVPCGTFRRYVLGYQDCVLGYSQPSLRYQAGQASTAAASVS